MNARGCSYEVKACGGSTGFVRKHENPECCFSAIHTGKKGYKSS